MKNHSIGGLPGPGYWDPTPERRVHWGYGGVRNCQGAGTISRLTGCKHHTKMSITLVIGFS